MRILEVTFSNLNSLRGKFHIDFASPGLAGRGVFLAWGPTGAGKTTIFDAVCLALYGRTPRLDGVNQAHNDIMSKNAKDCLAEARFDVGGAVYRARFAQKRTNKGKLGEVERVIYDAGDGVVTEGIRPCDQKITELTGLRAEQFMQTVMLPQGGFSAFLQAAPKDRAPILARLTKAGEYERIAAKVHALYGERQKKVDECQARIEGMTGALLSPEEAAAKETELQIGKTRERERKAEIAALDAAVKRADEKAKLQERRGELDRESEALQKAESAFTPKGERLERHLRAEKIVPVWAAFAAAAKRLADERADLARQEKELPEKQKNETTTAQAAQMAAAQFDAAEQAEKDAAPALAGADKLQEERAVLARDRERLGNEWKAKDKARQAAQTQKNEAETALKNAETKLAALAPPPAADAYARALAAMAPDALREEEGRERQAQDAWGRAAEALQVAAGARDALPPLNEKLNDATAKATDLTMRLQGARALTAERRKTHDAARESLTNAELAAKYAADRAGLREGEPCPLCGAAHHPLAGQSNEEAEERRGAAQKRWQEAQAALAESESAERGLDRELASADSDKRHAEEALAEAKRTWNEAWQKVEPALKAAGGSAPAEEGLAEALAAAEGEVKRHAARLAAAARQ
ncbi:MAG: AAA family ATPase, partial [Planctomycetes bacterium]|nr:AAA family ATPase [Planctomycetota bacterium]